MPFLGKIDLDATAEARQSRRFLADRLDGVLVGKGRRFDIIVHNVSETGFLAEFPSDLKPGDTVRLQLARIGFVDARVVRRRGMGHGCQFLERVPADIVAETITASVGVPLQADLPPDDTDGEGYRRRVTQARRGALIVFAALLAGVLVVTLALIRILSS